MEQFNAQFEQAKTRIESLTKKWSALMDLGWLSIRHTFNPNLDDDEPHVVATTDADWEYRAAVVDWHLPRVTAIADDTLEAVVVHEYCHVLLSPVESTLKESQSKLGEFTTESFARAILAVRNYYEPQEVK